jgi:hypothetical protein
MRFLLQELASGKPIPVNNAVTWLTMLGHETAEYVHATGDTEAAAAFGDIHGSLIGQSPDAKPITVLAERRRSR